MGFRRVRAMPLVGEQSAADSDGGDHDGELRGDEGSDGGARGGGEPMRAWGGAAGRHPRCPRLHLGNPAQARANRPGCARRRSGQRHGDFGAHVGGQSTAAVDPYETIITGGEPAARAHGRSKASGPPPVAAARTRSKPPLASIARAPRWRRNESGNWLLNSASSSQRRGDPDSRCDAGFFGVRLFLPRVRGHPRTRTTLSPGSSPSRPGRAEPDAPDPARLTVEDGLVRNRLVVVDHNEIVGMPTTTTSSEAHRASD